MTYGSNAWDQILRISARLFRQTCGHFAHILLYLFKRKCFSVVHSAKNYLFKSRYGTVFILKLWAELKTYTLFGSVSKPMILSGNQSITIWDGFSSISVGLFSFGMHGGDVRVQIFGKSKEQHRLVSRTSDDSMQLYCQ